MASSPLPAYSPSLEMVLRTWVQSVLQSQGIVLEDEKIFWERPAQESHGDWATPLALQLFQQRANWPESPLFVNASSPRAVAEQLLQLLQDDQSSSVEPTWIDSLSVAGPGFINVRLSESYWLQIPHMIVSAGNEFGRLDIGADQVWEVEHTSPNPNKAMHLGHLRTNVTGMSLANIWEAVGVKVIRESVDNNRGISIAKLMWGFLKFARKSTDTPIDLAYWSENPEKWMTPEESGQRPDRFMDNLYVQGAADCESSPESEALVRQWVVDWEAKDPLNWKLWRHVLEYVYEGQNLTLERLHNHFDHVWHEHDHYEAGKEWVQQGVESGVFRQLEDSAILTNLETYKIPDTVVQKKDGTSLYITQDIALTNLKNQAYQPDRLVWVVGSEQSLALQQMFAVCEQLGIVTLQQCEHINYGFMSIKGQGKMSSRKGNTIFIDDLLDMARDSVRSRIQNDDLSETDKDAVAELLAESAVKYAILKVGRTTDTQFDVETSISLEGDSGPYLQYTHARCCSILRQAENDLVVSGEFDSSLHPSEVALVRWLDRYPEIVSEAAHAAAPNMIAQYLYELAQRFNAFYSQVSVLNADSAAARAHRLQEVRSVAQVLKSGFALLGFAAVERM